MPSIRIAVVVVVLAGLAVRIATAGYSMWFDEFASIVFADKPLPLLWSDWMRRETNPPLFYSLLHGWMLLWGKSLLALRMLPILLGTIGIAVLAAIAARGYGLRAAWITAAIAGLSAQLIYYGQMLRAYTLAFDGVALSLFGLLLLLTERRGSRFPGAAVYAAGGVIAIHSHTTLFLWPPVATLGLLIVLGRETDRRMILTLAAANMAILIATAWWLRMTFIQLRVSRSNIDWIPPLDLPQSLELVLRSAFLIRGETAATLLASGAVLALTGLAALFTWRKPATRLVAISGALSVVVLCAAQAYRPILLERTTLWLSIFPIVLIGGWLGGIERPAARWSLSSALALLLATNTAEASRRFQTQDWIPSIRRIAAEPGGVLLVEHEAMGLVSAVACEVAFPAQRRCPVPIVTMRSASPSNVWAKGLHDAPLHEPRDLAGAFPPNARIFALRQGDLDVVVSLQAAGASIRPTATRAWPEGPYSPDDLRIRTLP